MTSKATYMTLADITQKDADAYQGYSAALNEELPDRILAALRQLDRVHVSMPVSRLEHVLQAATRAYRDDKGQEYVVAALLHDIGDLFAPYSHAEYAAVILGPFVSERIQWIIRHHAVFESFYYAHLNGGDRMAREKYHGHPYFRDAIEFCEKYDCVCFDPGFASLPLEFFEPMVRDVFSRPRHLKP
jgi:predicted HD phosphohydrolase